MELETLRPFAFVVLAALALAGVPTGSSLPECPELAIVETLKTPLAERPATFGVPGCSDEPALLLTSNVLVRWSHDEAGITGLTVVLEGAGVDPTPMPMEGHTYLDGMDALKEKTHHETPIVHFASPYGGTLTATLYRDGVPVAVARAVAVL